MSDKTALERDIETHEQDKTPFSVAIFIFLVLIGFGAVGVYVFDLRETIAEKDHEIKMLKIEFRAEKVELLSRIKKLEKKPN